MLRDMGAKINGETTGTIHICGAEKLHGTEVTIPGDRIVFMTYAAMALGTQGKFVFGQKKSRFFRNEKNWKKPDVFLHRTRREFLQKEIRAFIRFLI